MCYGKTGQYGRVAIRVANRESYFAAFQLFAGQKFVEDARIGSSTSHKDLVERSKLGFGSDAPDRYNLLGTMMVLHVLRDRFPRDDTSYRESLMKPLHDYDTFPPEDWGERHSVGVELIAGYEDRLVPSRPAKWRFGVQVQTRFDKPGDPQLAIKSRFDGLVDTRDMGYHSSFKPEMTDRKRASWLDVAAIAEVFEQAKDIRPIVSRIDRQLREQAVISKMIGEFFHPSDAHAGPTADTVSGSKSSRGRRG